MLILTNQVRRLDRGVNSKIHRPQETVVLILTNQIRRFIDREKIEKFNFFFNFLLVMLCSNHCTICIIMHVLYLH